MTHTTPRHDELVAALVAIGARTDRFMRTLAAELAADDVELADWRAEVAGLRILPDAYQIDCDERAVIAYEVEITSRLTQEKLDRYSRLWWALDQYEWTLVVVPIDRAGRHSVFDPFLDYMERAA